MQEDDLRGLAKIMAFMRAVSILLVLMNFYWFCYSFFHGKGWTLEVIEKILQNFQKTSGLFNNSFNSKLFALILLALSCLGTKGVKNEKIKWQNINMYLIIGSILYLLNFPLLQFSNTLYMLTTSAGFILLMVAGLWMSRLLRNRLMDDPFNTENESFMQETRLIENEYSVNLPTKFYYKGKWNDGWISVVNVFRASIVLGTPGGCRAIFN